MEKTNTHTHPNKTNISLAMIKMATSMNLHRIQIDFHLGSMPARSKHSTSYTSYCTSLLYVECLFYYYHLWNAHYSVMRISFLSDSKWIRFIGIEMLEVQMEWQIKTEQEKHFEDNELIQIQYINPNRQQATVYDSSKIKMNAMFWFSFYKCTYCVHSPGLL